MAMTLDRAAANLFDVFRTVEVALPIDNTLSRTPNVFNRARQSVLNYGLRTRMPDKNSLKYTCSIGEESASCYQT
jgi:hypothetical protein